MVTFEGAGQRDAAAALIQRAFRIAPGGTPAHVVRIEIPEGDLGDIADVKRRFSQGRFRRAEPVISGAIARGQLPAGTDPAEAVRFLVPPIYLRLLVTGEPVSETSAVTL